MRDCYPISHAVQSNFRQALARCVLSFCKVQVINRLFIQPAVIKRLW